MQQYGAPTRVLDWTVSAYIALYFAMEKEPEKDGAVWVFRTHSPYKHHQEVFGRTKPPQIEEQARAFWDDKAASELFVLDPNTCTDRMVAQRMTFTVSLNGLADHGQLLAEILPEDSHFHELTKIIIPALAKSQFMRRLREMNVTARTLFPGVEGIGRAGAELTKTTSEWFRSQNNPQMGTQ